MKKTLTVLLLLAMCLGVLAACTSKDADETTGSETTTGSVTETTAPESGSETGTETETETEAETKPAASGLESAVSYLHNLYKDMPVITASDYTVVDTVMIAGVKYTVEWTVDVKEGVVIEKGEKHMMIVNVDEKAVADIAYTLTATVKDADGNTQTKSYKHTVPAYKVNTFDEYVTAEKGTNLIVKGTVSGIISKSQGSKNNCIYVQDAKDGGYYVYGMKDDPVADLKLELGMTVEVTGVKDVYNGTLELKDAKVAILSKEKTEITPVDYTEIFKNAADLKAADLVAKQGMLVTIKGVEITDQVADKGYFNFKLGEKSTYIRISGSTSALDKDGKAALKAGHSEHFGYIANVTGVISLYDGAFYLVPVTAGAFEYLSLPEIPDDQKVQKELDALKLPERITEDTVIALSLKGGSYETVTFAWVSDNACAVIGEDGKLTITLPEADTTVKITVTATCGDKTATKEFTLIVDSAPTDLYIPSKVEKPVVKTAYKFYMYQANLNKYLYLTGEMSGHYMATTDRADKGVDVFMEEVTGGVRFFFMRGEEKVYLDLYEYAAGKVGVRLATEAEATASKKPLAVFTFNETHKIYTAKITDKEFYFGTKDKFTDFSAKMLKADTFGKTEFAGYCATLKFAHYSPVTVEKPVVKTAYKFYMYQANLNKYLYLTGEMSGHYMATTDRADKGVDVFMEEVTGGVRFFFMRGEEKVYLDLYEYATGKVGVRLATEAEATASGKPLAVFTFNEAHKIYTAKVTEKEFYFGTKDKFTDFSAKMLKADTFGKTEFAGYCATVSLVEVAPTAPATPAAKVPYKFYMAQNILGKDLFFAGYLVDGSYLATTESLSKAVDVFIEETNGGFYIYFMDGKTKTYINISVAKGKGSITLDTTATTVYTYDAELLKGMKASIATTDKEDNPVNVDYYLGTYKDHNTIGASKTSYVDANNVDKEQFVARFVTMEEVKPLA